MVARLSGIVSRGSVEAAAPRRLGPARGVAAPATPVAPLLPMAPVAALAPVPLAPETPPPPAVPMVPEAEAEARERRAAEQGWRRGLDEGHQAAQREHARWVEGLVQAAAASAATLDRRLADAGSLALALAGQALEQLLGDAGARLPLLEQLLHHRVAALRGASTVQLHLNPQDLESLGGAAALLVRLPVPSGLQLQVVADAAVAGGGCTLELELGSLDTGLDTARALIRQHFEAARDAQP